MANSNKKLLVQSAIVLAMTAAPALVPNQAHAAWGTLEDNLAITTTQTASANGQTLLLQKNATDDADVVVTGGIAADASTFTGLTITVNETDSAAHGLKSTGQFNTINASGTGTITTITNTKGTITGASTTSGLGTIFLGGGAATTTITNAANGTISNTGAGGDAIVIGDSDGDNQTITLSNAGSITTTNNASSIGISIADGNGGSTVALTNTATLSAGALGTAVNVAASSGGTANGFTLTSNNGGTITGAITGLGNSTITVTSNTGGTINGNISTVTGALAFTQGTGGAVTGNITTTSGDADVTLNNNSTIGGNIDLGTNSSSTLALNGTSAVTGDVTLGNAAQTLTFNGGTITGNVKAATTGSGDIVVSASTVTNGDIGTNALQIDDVTIGAFTLNLDTNDDDLYADAVTLNAAGATLTLGTGAFDATVDGDADSHGILNLNGSVTPAQDVGATHKLATISVASGVTITSAHKLAADDVNINGVLNQSAGTVGATGATIDVESTGTFTLSGTGDFTGTIDGNNAAEGTVNLDRDFTTSSTKVLGGADGLGALNIKTGRTLTVGGNIKATTTTVEGTGVIDLGETAARTITGALTLAGGGSTLDLGNSKTHAVSGTLTTGSGDTIATTISAVTGGSTITAGTITAGTSATNAGTIVGITLNSDAGYITDGATLKVVDGSAGTANDLTADTQIHVNGGDNATGVLTFSASSTGGGSDLTITINRATYASVATNANADSVGTAMSTVGSSSTGNLLLLQVAADNAESASALTTILDSATSQTDNSLTQGVFDVVGQGVAVVDERLGALRTDTAGLTTGMSAGYVPAGTGAWIQGFGSTSDQDTVNGISGYESDTYGVAVGADRKVRDDMRIGVSLAYANSQLDSKSNTKSTDADTYQINVYGTKEYGKFYTDGVLGFSYNQLDSTRKIAAIPATATAGFDGQTYLAKIGGGYTHKVPNSGLEIVPNASLSYAYNTVQGYTEKGAGAANLKVDSENSSLLQGKIGANVGYNFNAKGLKVRPEIRAAYLYDFIGDNQENTAEFTGTGVNFKTEGANVEKSSYNLGAGLDLVSKGGYTVSADYDYKGKSDYSSHSGVLRLRYDF